MENCTYDAVGNRLTSAGPTTYDYNSSNELTSDSAAMFTYDNNGNTTSKTTSAGTTSYTWDFENRLSSVSLPGTGGTVNFKYDPFGRRIYKCSPAGTTIYVYDGDNVIQELGGSGNPLASYTQGGGVDEPLALFQGLNASYYQTDGLGSITFLTDSTGAVAASYVYDSFGNLTASTGTITNPYRYTGREFDPETGLCYYRARYYDPQVGRFLGEDPSRFAGDRGNFYTYVGNDSANYRDPTGLWSPAAHDALIRHALQGCGVPPDQIESLQRHSREWDESSQDPSQANYHSMEQPAQSIADAINRRNRIYINEMNLAKAEYAQGYEAEALFDMAIAIHAMMHMTSPAHIDAQGPIMWCGLMGCSAEQDPSGRSKGNFVKHSPVEGVGIEDVRHLTDAIYGLNDDMIRDSYSYMTGKTLKCGCKK